MDIQLIRLYLLALRTLRYAAQHLLQRISNNANPDSITDQELVTIYWFAHLHGRFEKKAMHQFIHHYWRRSSRNCPAIRPSPRA
jgi:hypothetical protein